MQVEAFLCTFKLEKHYQYTFLKVIGFIVVVIFLLYLFPCYSLTCALLTSVNNICITCMQPMVTFFDNKLQLLQFAGPFIVALLVLFNLFGSSVVDEFMFLFIPFIVIFL